MLFLPSPHPQPIHQKSPCHHLQRRIGTQPWATTSAPTTPGPATVPLTWASRPASSLLSRPPCLARSACSLPRSRSALRCVSGCLCLPLCLPGFFPRPAWCLCSNLGACPSLLLQGDPPFILAGADPVRRSPRALAHLPAVLPRLASCRRMQPSWGSIQGTPLWTRAATRICQTFKKRRRRRRRRRRRKKRWVSGPAPSRSRWLATASGGRGPRYRGEEGLGGPSGSCGLRPQSQWLLPCASSILGVRPGPSAAWQLGSSSGPASTLLKRKGGTEAPGSVTSPTQACFMQRPLRASWELGASEEGLGGPTPSRPGLFPTLSPSAHPILGRAP